MTPKQHLADHELKSAISDELAFTPAVNADHIGVAVNEGAVTLSGEVRTYPEKHAAIRAALRVRGVTALADEIVVETPGGPRQDADVAREAADALARTITVPAGTVKATVHDHVITLTGTVAWHFVREAARRAVAELPGVRDVRNLITISPPEQHISPGATKAKITSALLRNAQLDAQRIQVEVIGHEVRLTGMVSSWAERRQAEQAAWSSAGVTEVNNQLVVSE